jgi:L-aminopeptidase/D-esterase-like protein
MSQKWSTRRDFLLSASGVLIGSHSFASAGKPLRMSPDLSGAVASLCDVTGIKVGHYTDARRPTGCTVILTEAGATAGVDVRGSAPGTRETDLLHPLSTVDRIHAILLSGGSAFGLDAASGVMQFLEEKGIGYYTPAGKVPLVPAAILFDLEVGDPRIRPDSHAGYLACKNATAESGDEGNVGAGAGATVGKLLGFEKAMKGGTGTASIRSGTTVVGAIVAVNAAGDVVDPQNGRILAGARAADGKTLANTIDRIRHGKLSPFSSLKENTTIGVVATNIPLSKSQANKMAQMAHDGLARSVNPVHTPVDGDTLFALSTHAAPNRDSDANIFELIQIGALAAEAVAMAVCRAVLAAKGLPGLPSHHDIFGSELRG